MQFGFIFALIASILISIFAIQNASPVTIDLFFASFKISEALVILASVALGAILAVILGSIRQIKNISSSKESKNKIKQMESTNLELGQQIANYENDINTLRNEKKDCDDQLAKIRVNNNQLNEMNNELKKEIVAKSQEIEKMKLQVSNMSNKNDCITEIDVSTDNAYLNENNEKGKAES